MVWGMAWWYGVWSWCEVWLWYGVWSWCGAWHGGMGRGHGVRCGYGMGRGHGVRCGHSMGVVMV